MALLLGIDTGGTYTDAVLYDQEAGVLAAAKALTTKHDLAQGVAEAARAVLPDPAPEIGLVALSTTLATNAVVEGHGRRVCLLLVGFDESALERASLRQALGDDPVVFLTGGHTGHGEEQAPLDLAAARAAIEAHAEDVAAFAITGHFAVRNPAHERALRELVRSLTDKPVTCGHELSSDLDAPRRALTALLNARLIPLLQELVVSVRGFLESQGIRAPLMVVKGDGSLIAAEAALGRPIETVLSGPAASAVGARALSGEADVVIADMGGTTTDIAVLRGGQPLLRRDGANVGGWRTMVEAVAVHTVGLGGDSEVGLDREAGLRVGPRRSVPLALLALQHPAMLEHLRAQAETPPRGEHGGRFALRLRALDPAGAASLRKAERRIWELLAEGPLPLSAVVGNYLDGRALERLVYGGLAVLSGFTPSDAAHVLGLQRGWSLEAARHGAVIWARAAGELAAAGAGRALKGFSAADPEGFCRAVVAQVTRQGCEAIATAVLAEEGSGEPVRARARGLGARLVEKALGGTGQGGGLLAVSFRLEAPLVAIGAPAATYFPAIAERLNTRLVVPPHAGVCNAVGAVASGVLQRVSLLITAPAEGRYRLHLAEGTRDFTDLEDAAASASAAAEKAAAEHARLAGAAEVVVEVERRDRIAPSPDGIKTFIDSTVTARAAGRPRLAGESLAGEASRDA